MTIVFQNGIAGKICANSECGWKPLSEFHPRRISGLPAGDGYKSRCRECLNAQRRAERSAKLEQYRESNRKYSDANKDHYRDLKRAHQKANPERYKAALRKYRVTHREEINTRARERRQQDLEHYREIGRKSRERHAEQRNAYQRKYSKENRDRLTLYTNNRRARKLQAEGFHTDEEWQELKTFYKYTCIHCGKQEPEIKLTRDHVIPLVWGGTDSIDNIQPLCSRCNSKKNHKHIDYR